MRHKSFIYNNLVGIRLLYRLFPKSIILYSALQMLHGVSWVLQVMSVQYFFDGISENQGEISRLVIKILLLGAAYAFAQIMNGVANCYGQILNRKVTKETNKILFRTLDQKEAIAFEYADELDRINKAACGCEGVFWVSTTILDIVFFYVFYFVMMGWYLFSLAPVLSISIVIIFIPNVTARLLHMISFEHLESEAAPVRRKMDYYADCITGKEYHKETRLWGCGKYFFDRYNRTLKKLNRLQFHMQVRKEKINFCINVLTVSAYGIIIGMLVYYVLTDSISVGAFAAVFAALREFYGFMDEVISERLAIAMENMATVKNYLSFIDPAVREESVRRVQKEDKEESVRRVQKTDKEEAEQIKLPEKFEIRLEHVSFAYPQPETGERKYALSDIDLLIPWGQTVALVGENGSGKSTLCHIIAGLYSPSEGAISYGGVCRGGRRIVSGISAVFQKFCRYSMSLGENVRISDLEADKSEDRLNQICRETGVVPEWAGGMDGMLGREFGGAEVSGGQWQRIAIARGMYRNNSLLILDEPTAAIDALEEKYLYEEFGKLSRNCTSIIVTHRLASAQIADRILVMKDGRIVQDGTHEELVEAQGEYKAMYELQRQWYR
ncbi:MAG: ABC transporter ATP-binding protein [Lachnospiraceae bacterium]|jgi:ATP-binding cassette subfamily B protein|nr:ABC transporter ATP-binding protein [Lachnospiraceae bacterium]